MFSVPLLRVHSFTENPPFWIPTSQSKMALPPELSIREEFGNVTPSAKPRRMEENSEEVSVKEGKLDARVARFVALIFSMNILEHHIPEIGYMAAQPPLGRPSKGEISKGYAVLEKIDNSITRELDFGTLEKLAKEFYGALPPRDPGLGNMNTLMIEEVVTYLLLGAYHGLDCLLTPVEANSEEYKMIHKYMMNSLQNSELKIVQILRISKISEERQFSTTIGNKKLLWHGSRLSNFPGILREGLRIRAPGAPISGELFGEGVYFSDSFANSEKYCCAFDFKGNSVVLLCEVALGDMLELIYPNSNLVLPEEKNSVKGIGYWGPHPSGDLDLDGVILPVGEKKDLLTPSQVMDLSDKGMDCFDENEYVVYETNQVKMRYILHASKREENTQPME